MEQSTEQTWNVIYYVTARDECPVRDFINSLPKKEQVVIARQIVLLEQLGIKIGMPHARKLSGHQPLWELRPSSNRIIYVIFRDRRIFLLHGFKKKSNKTPIQDINVAMNHYKDLLERES